MPLRLETVASTTSMLRVAGLKEYDISAAPFLPLYVSTSFTNVFVVTQLVGDVKCVTERSSIQRMCASASSRDENVGSTRSALSVSLRSLRSAW